MANSPRSIRRLLLGLLAVLLVLGWVTLRAPLSAFAGVGDPDASFGITGTATTGTGIATAQNAGGTSSTFYAGSVVAVTVEQLSGANDVVAAGQFTSSNDLALARFLPNGAPDAAFGANGLVHLGISSSAAEAVAVDPSTGNLVAAGYDGTSGTDYPALSASSPTGVSSPGDRSSSPPE